MNAYVSLQEFEKMNIPGYQLIKQNSYYYLSTAKPRLIPHNAVDHDAVVTELDKLRGSFNGDVDDVDEHHSGLYMYIHRIDKQTSF